MTHEKTTPPGIPEVNTAFFQTFWRKIQKYLVQQYGNTDVPPMLIAAKVLPPEDHGKPVLGFVVCDMRMFFQEGLGQTGKLAAASVAKTILEEEDTLLVANVNESWVVQRDLDRASGQPVSLAGAVSEQPDREEVLLVYLNSKTRQAFSMSPIKRDGELRTIEFADIQFNDENGAMVDGIFNLNRPSTVH